MCCGIGVHLFLCRSALVARFKCLASGGFSSRQEYMFKSCAVQPSRRVPGLWSPQSCIRFASDVPCSSFAALPAHAHNTVCTRTAVGLYGWSEASSRPRQPAHVGPTRSTLRASLSFRVPARVTHFSFPVPSIPTATTILFPAVHNQLPFFPTCAPISPSAFRIACCTVRASAVNQWRLPPVLVLAAATGRPRGAQPGAQPGVAVLESVGALREPIVTAMFPWIASVAAIRQPALRPNPLAAAAAAEAGDRLEHPRGSLRMFGTTCRSRMAVLGARNPT